MPKSAGQIKQLPGVTFRTLGDRFPYAYIEHMTTFMTSNDVASKMNIPPFDAELLAFDEKSGGFSACPLNETGKSGTGYSHFQSCLRVIHTQVIR